MWWEAKLVGQTVLQPNDTGQTSVPSVAATKAGGSFTVRKCNFGFRYSNVLTGVIGNCLLVGGSCRLCRQIPREKWIQLGSRLWKRPGEATLPQAHRTWALFWHLSKPWATQGKHLFALGRDKCRHFKDDDRINCQECSGDPSTKEREREMCWGLSFLMPNTKCSHIVHIHQCQLGYEAHQGECGQTLNC